MESAENTSSNESWISELKSPLLRFARSLGLSLHDAEDAVQDGLIALVRAREKNPEPIRNPKAYAFTIVRNNANKHFRDRNRRNEVEMPEDHPESQNETEVYEEPLLKQSFQAAYANLGVTERNMLRKYYVEKWTYEEIGAELGCSAQNAWKTIKKIVSQILAGEVRKTLTQADPAFAKELFPD